MPQQVREGAKKCQVPNSCTIVGGKKRFGFLGVIVKCHRSSDSSRSSSVAAFVAVSAAGRAAARVITTTKNSRLT